MCILCILEGTFHLTWSIFSSSSNNKLGLFNSLLKGAVFTLNIGLTGLSKQCRARSVAIEHDHSHQQYRLVLAYTTVITVCHLSRASTGTCIKMDLLKF